MLACWFLVVTNRGHNHRPNLGVTLLKWFIADGKNIRCKSSGFENHEKSTPIFFVESFFSKKILFDENITWPKEFYEKNFDEKILDKKTFDEKNRCRKIILKFEAECSNFDRGDGLASKWRNRNGVDIWYRARSFTQLFEVRRHSLFILF